MTNFSTDADLLKWEPNLFHEIREYGQLGLEHQCLVRGGDASSRGRQVTTPTPRFKNTHPGHVIHLTAAGERFDGYYDIEYVVSESKLYVWPPLSTIRNLDYEIHTFDRQHEEALWALLARFGLLDHERIATEDIGQWLLKYPQLQWASAALVLATVYRSQAAGGPADGALMRKAEHYARVYEERVAKVRPAMKEGGERKDG